MIARVSAVLLLLFASRCTGQAASVFTGALAPSALKQLTLDELINLEVTSVSKTAETFRHAAAALTVVPQEHIRRSGATTIPGALRAVPGLYVGRKTASVWALGARGFNSTNSEKLLVLSDTRSIYTPLYSGVFWDVQDYLLTDVDRVEVIRGPGAALWGSNAVNGVINITTKHAADTHGTRLETTVGTELHGMVAARQGGETSGGVHYRVFGKYFDRDETFNVGPNSDDWRLGHLGFRADWAASTQDEFTVQGDVYYGNIGLLAPSAIIEGRPGPTGTLETRVTGGNILGRWRHRIDANTEWQVRGYYDRTHRNDPSFVDDLDTIDLDLQHRFAPADKHEILWGMNYRFTHNRNQPKVIFAVDPPTSDDHVLSGFVQDQIALQETLHVTVGTKLEQNDFSGFELQPSVRAAWQITPKHTVWAAVSRAARVPTRLERDIAIDVTDPAGNPVFRLVGNEDFRAEELIAYELGFRWLATDQVHVDLALFENRYDKLASLEVGTPFVNPATGQTIVPILSQNLTDGRARGVETLVTYSPVPWWRLSASYAYLDLELDSAGLDLNRGEFYDGATPRHQFALSSYVTLRDRLELDAHFRSLSAIRRFPEDSSGGGIPSYNELDIHLSWRASDDTTISVVGQNLLHSRHVEFGAPDTRGEIERGAYIQIAWDL